MSLSIHDSEIFAATLKKGRKKMGLTQAKCAELLGHSLSFQKDLERGRCSVSLEGFFEICRVLNISADDCIFYNSNKNDSSIHELSRLISRCSENSIQVLIATAEALIDVQEKKTDNQHYSQKSIESEK